VRGEWALNPSDTGIQQKLKALFDLQTILKLQHQQLPPEQIRQIQEQVIQLSPAPAPPAPASTTVSNSTPSFPPVLPQSATPVQQPSTPFSLSQFLAQNLPQPQPSSTPVSLPQILRQSATPTQGSSTPMSVPPVYRPSVPSAPIPSNSPSLAQLLQQFGPAATPTAPTPTPAPPPPVSLAQLFSQPTTTANPVGGADWLLNALRSQNLLGSNTGTPIPPAPAQVSVSSLFPSTEPVDRSWSSSVRVENDVELTTTSITKKYVVLLIDERNGLTRCLDLVPI
jgi:pre-mRNA cleavage complex 2 protein Pcf11